MVPFGNFGWNFGFGWLVIILSFILLVPGIVQLVWTGYGDRRSGPGRVPATYWKRGMREARSARNSLKV